MNFGFRAEVGYDAANDTTFLRTNSPDFTEQLVFPVARGSKQDEEIRKLLEEQEIIDFQEVNDTITLPTVDYDISFGTVAGVEDEDLTPENYPHLVLFGKSGSGAKNLIRFWLLNANQRSLRVVAIGTPANLYGHVKYLNSNLVHMLDTGLPFKEQFEALGRIDTYCGAQRTLLIVGEEFEAITLEDRLFLKEIQDGKYRAPETNILHEHMVLSLVHRSEFVENFDEYFVGGDSKLTSYAAMGTVNSAVAKMVGEDVPASSKTGVAWISNEAGEVKRVKTYLVPQSLVRKGASWNRTILD